MERIIFQTFGGNTIWPIWLNWFFSKSLNKIKSFFEVTINYYICWQYFYKAFFVLVPTYNGQVINVQGKVLLPWIEPGSSGIRSNHCVIYLCRYRFVRKCIFLKIVFLNLSHFSVKILEAFTINCQEFATYYQEFATNYQEFATNYQEFATYYPGSGFWLG